MSTNDPRNTVDGLETSVLGELSPGRMLGGNYELVEPIGRGGMGQVWKAQDQAGHRSIAIKLLPAELRNHEDAIQQVRESFQKVHALTHQHIGKSLAMLSDVSFGPFIVMDLVPGIPLSRYAKQYRQRDGEIPLQHVVELLRPVAKALDYAHGRGVLHRDVKPENILVQPEPYFEVTLIDFGLAATIRSTMTRFTQASTDTRGTRPYMSPEQLRGNSRLWDGRTDQYSLAVVAYELLGGYLPFETEDDFALMYAVLNEPVSSIEGCSEPINQALLKGLEKEKAGRYENCVGFIDALASILVTKVPTAATRASLASRSAPLGQLATGECPRCRSRNEPHRKFCSACADALLVNCLKCNAEIPVWDKVCAECGGKQADLIEECLSTLQQQRNHAEQLRLESQYQAALRIAKEVTLITDERLTQYRPWAEEFLKSTQEQWDNEQAAARQHFAEAQRHRAAFDYLSAIREIHAIADPLRLAEVTAFLDHLESDHRESRDLLQTIASRIEQRDIDGLLEQVDRAIELNGDRADLLKLQSQLRDRETKLVKQRDHVFDQATKLLVEGKAREALSAVRTVRGATLPEQARLTKKLEQIVNSEDVLTALVEKAKGNGWIDSRQVVDLLPKVLDYLKLNPHHVNVIKTCDYLYSRIPTISSIEILQLPAKVLSSLPAEVLGKLPAEVLCKLSVEVLSKLPAKTLERLYITNSFGIKLRLIGSGTFMMGSLDSEADRDFDETQYRVTLTKSYYLGTTQVTQGQWKSVMGTTPWKGQRCVLEGSNHAASHVNWNDAVKFCRKLSAEEGKTYRLPTEAEWEYACRAGTTTAYSFGDDASQLSDYGWFVKNANDMGEQYAHAVGLKRSNGFGLYDMHGNVWEWCSDWYHDYPTGSVTDPQGGIGGYDRVFRGGSWGVDAAFCRSAHRSPFVQSHLYSGLRLALSPSIQATEAGQVK